MTSFSSSLAKPNHSKHITVNLISSTTADPGFGIAIAHTKVNSKGFAGDWEFVGYDFRPVKLTKRPAQQT